MEVCRKGNRWWYSFDCTSQLRSDHISWIPRNLELGSYLMDLQLGNVFTSGNLGVPKSRSLKEVSLFSERFSWEWVSSAWGELSWCSGPQDMVPDPARTGAASSVWTFCLQGSSFYLSLQQFWWQNCPRSKQQGRPGSLWVIWGTTNVPCAVPIALQQLSPKKELAVLSSCSVLFPNKDFQP